MEFLETFHMEKRTFIKWLVWVPFTVSLLLGCGGRGMELKKIEGNPETLYREGLARFNKKDYIEAQKKFEELKSSFPDSPPYTILAELKVGDCHFLKKEYVEAIAAYEEFKKTHPSYEEIPYVQFQIGMSYFNQILTLDRDQTSTKKALSSFEYLIASYPPSLFTEKAKEKIEVCKQRLAAHEFYVGNFYYRHGKFEAAAQRLQGLLEKFPKAPEEDQTLYLLGKSYLELGLWKRAEVVFMKIVTEYPKSPHVKEARATLDKGPTNEEVSVEKDEATAFDPKNITWNKFEEEGKQPLSLNEEKKVDLSKESEKSTFFALMGAPVQASSPQERKDVVSGSPPAIEPASEERTHGLPPAEDVNKSEPVLPMEPMKQDRVQTALPPLSADTSKVEASPDEEREAPLPTPSTPSREKEDVEKKTLPETTMAELANPVDKGQPIAVASATKPTPENPTLAIPHSADPNKSEPILSVEPTKEDRMQAALPPLSADTAFKVEVKPDEEKRGAALPITSAPPRDKEDVQQKVLPESTTAKLMNPADKGQPIDVTSDKVESRWKENLVIFKGNVIARQKDLVIYADSLEVVTLEDGKGIERVIAGGNVKIQQGIRVANCQKAVFYNLDQKMVLTGDPKVSEGDNVVLGDEITFDINKNRVEVKGGPSGRGKAKVQPGEIQKLK
jgi:outer membrane protein assembly factor BamD